MIPNTFYNSPLTTRSRSNSGRPSSNITPTATTHRRNRLIRQQLGDSPGSDQPLAAAADHHAASGRRPSTPMDTNASLSDPRLVDTAFGPGDILLPLEFGSNFHGDDSLDETCMNGTPDPTQSANHRATNLSQPQVASLSYSSGGTPLGRPLRDRGATISQLVAMMQEQQSTLQQQAAMMEKVVSNQEQQNNKIKEFQEKLSTLEATLSDHTPITSSRKKIKVSRTILVSIIN